MKIKFIITTAILTLGLILSGCTATRESQVSQTESQASQKKSFENETFEKDSSITLKETSVKESSNQSDKLVRNFFSNVNSKDKNTLATILTDFGKKCPISGDVDNLEYVKPLKIKEETNFFEDYSRSTGNPSQNLTKENCKSFMVDAEVKYLAGHEDLKNGNYFIYVYLVRNDATAPWMIGEIMQSEPTDIQKDYFNSLK